jgi:hypothetical protein
MSLFVIIVVTALVGLFSVLSIFPLAFNDSDNDLLVQLND